jgi:hypothetical protein
MSALSDFYYESAQKALATVDPISPAPISPLCELGGTQENKRESAGSPAVPEPRAIDAYQYPRKIRPGCQHQLGCGCDPPYWLRPSSPEEQAREAKIQGKQHG